MDTGFESVRDELFRAIERYDVKKLLKASSASSLEVISEEELHKLLKHKNKQWIREEFKRLILENGRLKSFAAFILDYNNHVQKAVFAVLQNESRFSTDTKLPLPANACPTRNRLKGCPADPIDLAESDDKSCINNYCSQMSSWSSSNSRTPPSPMEIDTKVCNAATYDFNLGCIYYIIGMIAHAFRIASYIIVNIVGSASALCVLQF